MNSSSPVNLPMSPMPADLSLFPNLVTTPKKTKGRTTTSLTGKIPKFRNLSLTSRYPCKPVPYQPTHHDLNWAPRPEPRWPIPPPPRSSTDSSNSDSDMSPLMTAPVSRASSRPGSQHSSHHSSQTASPHATPEGSRPPTPEGQAIRRSG